MAGAEGCANCARVEARVAKLEEANAKLQSENAKLRDRIERLEARLNRNSTNSSRPPSSDPPQIRQDRPPQPPTGRKPGGQPGHEGHTRELLPLTEVDKVIELHPKLCAGCGRRFKRRDLRRRTLPAERARRHQVTEIPEPKPHTTEWRMRAVECSHRRCGAVTWAQLPADVPRGRFGPRAQATVATLTGRYRSSRREAQAEMRELHGVTMSLGEVSAIEQNVSAALAEPVKEAHAYAQQQPSAGSDESGWWQGKRAGKRRAWLWVMVTSLVTVFLILKRRSGQAARKLLGTFEGVLCTDRWSAYKGWPPRRRQLCWAHLIRDFTEFVQRRHNAKASQRVGEALLQEARRMFAWWYRVRDGTLTLESFQTYMVPLRRRVRRLLRKGARCRQKLTARTCRDILSLEPALWTFVRVPGVEPTNNACERALRPAVLWRKGCFGTRSVAGSRFAERMLTVAATLKQQGRSLLDFLTLALDLHQSGERAPSLLPDAYTLRQLEATA